MEKGRLWVEDLLWRLCVLREIEQREDQKDRDNIVAVFIGPVFGSESVQQDEDADEAVQGEGSRHQDCVGKPSQRAPESRLQLDGAIAGDRS